MPVHPSEENAPEGLTEKVAKDPSSNTDSTASTHEHHHNEHTPGDVKAQASDFQSKGPQIPTNMDGMLSHALNSLGQHEADSYRLSPEGFKGGAQSEGRGVEQVRKAIRNTGSRGRS